MYFFKDFNKTKLYFEFIANVGLICMFQEFKISARKLK